MRSRLLDGASRLFRERGLAGASISDIAAAADAFPSQITYYFRTKEALFVEAACRDMLYVARAAEQAALQADTPRDYTRALVETVTATDSVAFFAEALTPDPAASGSRAAGRAHHRAAARRRAARLCRPDRAARLEHAARSRRDLAAVLGGRDRRDGRGLCDGPFGRTSCAARCCACSAIRRRHRTMPTARGCASSATATLRIQIRPTGRAHHDRASHARP